MIRSFARLPLICALLAGAWFFGPALLRAIHPQNAGPDSFELKFRLPPPKPLSPEEELATFKLDPGFRVELVAAEPLINTPVALSWDDQGRLFVCEMARYMQDVDGETEDEADCSIAVLEDSDGDGKLDKRTVFAEGLTLPRAVMCVNGGVLVGEPPSLWFMKDTDGDGKADVKELVDNNFGSRTGQPEHMANSPTWFMDNWIYCANHPMRYRLRDGKFVLDGGVSRGQWGLSQDDFGRPFYNFNSDFLRANFVPENYYLRNPNYPASAGAGVQVMKDQTCWPSHPTPGVNRGYEPKQLREDGTLTKSTATCGAAIYRGGLFPSEYAGNAFIPEPSGNLVKRVILTDEAGIVTASNAYEGTEFWTSTDERFRPVNAYTGPDGALYVVDMYRGVIQHRGFLTHYLVANIKDRQLEEPVDRGRIWRVVPEGAKPAARKLPKASAELVPLLADPNGWVRDSAQRLLVERKDATTAIALAKLASSGSTVGKLHALWTLEGIGALAPEVVAAALKDAEPKVRATAVRIADRTLAPELAKLIDDPSIEVRTALGFALSTWPESQASLVALLRKSGAEPMVKEASISGLRGRELEVLEELLAGKADFSHHETISAAALAQSVMGERRGARVKKLVRMLAALPANSLIQQRLLVGATTMKAGAKAKLLYVDQPLTELAQIASTADTKTQPLLAALDKRIAWPNKPGVPPPPVVPPLNAEQQQLFETGKTVYQTLCAACHQPNGTGMAGLAPPVLDSEWVLGDPAVVPRVILHGLSGPIKVNGQPWSLEMPPLGAALSDEQIAGVVTYLRREWEHGATPVSPKTVADLRARHKDRTKAWTAEELNELKKELKSAKR
jgi:mono/diheme cytochrome c family protein/glucose/arabinose dehydrogenase